MGSIMMSVIVVGLGVALGLARGGRLDALRSVRPQWWGLLLGGFALQAFAENVDIGGAASLSVIGMFLLVVGLVINAHLRGALIAAFGVSLNLIVMAVNGAVPIRFEALSEAGIISSTTERAQITSVGHLLELETSNSRLASLGDTIPVGFLSSVISIGDLVTFAGVIVIISNLIAARRTVGIEVDEMFARPVAGELDSELELETDIEFGELLPGSGLAAMFGTPAAVESDHDGAGILDIVAGDPIIDVSMPQDAPEPVVAEAPIDLTFDPDGIWADDDTGVRILGPSSTPNS